MNKYEFIKKFVPAEYQLEAEQELSNILIEYIAEYEYLNIEE